MQPISQDEEAIHRENRAFIEAWNRGDAKALAEFFTEDAVRVGAFGDIQHGRAEIEAAYDQLLHETMPGATIRLERGTVRMLGPDLAFWQGGFEITPVGGPALKGHVVQVMRRLTAGITEPGPFSGPWGFVAEAIRRDSDRWLVVEDHPKLFPPRP